jgi:hypothetical protein
VAKAARTMEQGTPSGSPLGETRLAFVGGGVLA